MKKYQVTERIVVNANLGFDRSKIMNYTIKLTDFPHKIIWSEGYAQLHSGVQVLVDEINPSSPVLTSKETKKIYQTIRMIKSLFEMEIKE